MSTVMKATRVKDHASSLLYNLSTMLHGDMLLDCTLVCDGQVIRAHKVILSSASEYFKKAFTSFSSTCSSTAIIIKDMPFAHLKMIIDYIYTGDVTYDSTNLLSLLQSADCLKVDTLVQHLLTLTDSTLTKSQQYQMSHRSSLSPNHQSHQSPVTQHTPYHHHRTEMNHHQQHHSRHQQEKVSRKSTSPTTSSSPASLLSVGSLKNLQMILPLQSTVSPSDVHSSTLAQALTNSTLRKESLVSGQLFHSVHNNSIPQHTTDDDSDNSLISNSESKLKHTVLQSTSSLHLNHAADESTGKQMHSHQSDMWRSCEMEEMEEEGRSPVDLSSSKSIFTATELNNNSSALKSESGKLHHHPPKARHFYANGNLLKNNHSSSSHIPNESISPTSSSHSPSNIMYDQSTLVSNSNSNILHHRIFSSSNSHKSLSSSDVVNVSPLKSTASLMDDSLEMSSRRDSLTSGESITLKRGRGRPPRYSIDDENWHHSSRLRSSVPQVHNCTDDCTDASSVKLEKCIGNSSSVNSSNNSNPLNNGSDSKSGASLSTPSSASTLDCTLESSSAGSTTKRMKLTFDTSSGSLRGRKPKLDYSSSSREVSGKNKCPHCPQVYYSTQAMSDHINNVHSKNRFKYVCQTCYKEFSWNISLKKHVRKAHGEESMITSLSQKLHWSHCRRGNL